MPYTGLPVTNKLYAGILLTAKINLVYIKLKTSNMKNFITLMVLILILGFTACRKEDVQQNTTSISMLQDEQSPGLAEKKSPNCVCPTPIGSALNRVKISCNKAVYHLAAVVHNTGAHWLIWELSGPAGKTSQIVPINTNDDAEGNPQTIDMGNISYPKDACFTVTITGYLSKPKKKDVSCSPEF